MFYYVLLTISIRPSWRSFSRQFDAPSRWPAIEICGWKDINVEKTEEHQRIATTSLNTTRRNPKNAKNTARAAESEHNLHPDLDDTVIQCLAGKHRLGLPMYGSTGQILHLCGRKHHAPQNKALPSALRSQTILQSQLKIVGRQTRVNWCCWLTKVWDRNLSNQKLSLHTLAPN